MNVLAPETRVNSEKGCNGTTVNKITENTADQRNNLLD
jgi:hypothetical protein